jgi:NAD(P)-dependent dehydrogenase (short-subunit alcohol dehydrogenase family)
MAPATGTVIQEWSVEMPTMPLDFKGKSVLVVGGTSGMGQAIAAECQAAGADVTVVGRSFKDDPNKIKFVKADLSLMSEAKKIGETIPTADVTVFTNGIIAAKTRKETAEGLEMNMAISYLSRVVILKYLTPRLKPNSRVFIMGFPGGNVDKYKIDDLNFEQSYEGGMMGTTQATSIVGNEAMVLDYASKSNGILFFGLNPGLVKTNIRSNMYTGFLAILGPIIEALIGLFSNSPASYAKSIAPLLFSSTLDSHNGSMFNPKAQPVKPSEYFSKDPGFAKKIIAESEGLIESKAGVKLP